MAILSPASQAKRIAIGINLKDTSLPHHLCKNTSHLSFAPTHAHQGGDLPNHNVQKNQLITFLYGPKTKK